MGVLEEVATAYAARLISRETALRMLAEGGWPIGDVGVEIERIQARAFDQAAALADATGDAEAVRDYLGMMPADSEKPPVPVLAGSSVPPAEREPEG
ncbi:hypothetical protein AB0J01_37815 [Streptomyces sp. NPDC050204]|uniref:hypothetical protein n=1 Tax=Streptomyces sp. NPDC050204 TaxID=3155514 RepID=UPI0034151B72